MFSEINAVMPGFINIRLNAAYLADFMNNMAKEEKLGVEEEGHGEWTTAEPTWQSRCMSATCVLP